MRRFMLAVGAVSLLVGAARVEAQGKPNFSGSWTQVVDPNAPAPQGRGGRGGGRGGLGMAATLTQDDKTLTITRTTQAGEIKTVYNLDGSDSKNMMTMGGNQVEQVSKAMWEGDKLKISTTMDFNGNTISSSQVFSLDASGQLVVEATNPGRGGGAPTTTTLMYKKG